MENICHARNTLRRPLLVRWIIRKRIDKGKKQSEKEMIRALRGAFCKGRYQSARVSEKYK